MENGGLKIMKPIDSLFRHTHTFSPVKTSDIKTSTSVPVIRPPFSAHQISPDLLGISPAEFSRQFLNKPGQPELIPVTQKQIKEWAVSLETLEGQKEGLTLIVEYHSTVTGLKDTWESLIRTRSKLSIPELSDQDIRRLALFLSAPEDYVKNLETIIAETYNDDHFATDFPNAQAIYEDLEEMTGTVCRLSRYHQWVMDQFLTNLYLPAGALWKELLKTGGSLPEPVKKTLREHIRLIKTMQEEILPHFLEDVTHIQPVATYLAAFECFSGIAGESFKNFLYAYQDNAYLNSLWEGVCEFDEPQRLTFLRLQAHGLTRKLLQQASRILTELSSADNTYRQYYNRLTDKPSLETRLSNFEKTAKELDGFFSLFRAENSLPEEHKKELDRVITALRKIQLPQVKEEATLTRFQTRLAHLGALLSGYATAWLPPFTAHFLSRLTPFITPSAQTKSPLSMDPDTLHFPLQEQPEFILKDFILANLAMFKTLQQSFTVSMFQKATLRSDNSAPEAPDETLRQTEEKICRAFLTESQWKKIEEGLALSRSSDSLNTASDHLYEKDYSGIPEKISAQTIADAWHRRHYHLVYAMCYSPSLESNTLHELCREFMKNPDTDQAFFLLELHRENLIALSLADAATLYHLAQTEKQPGLLRCLKLFFPVNDVLFNAVNANMPKEFITYLLAQGGDPLYKGSHSMSVIEKTLYLKRPDLLVCLLTGCDLSRPYLTPLAEKFLAASTEDQIGIFFTEAHTVKEKTLLYRLADPRVKDMLTAFTMATGYDLENERLLTSSEHKPVATIGHRLCQLAVVLGDCDGLALLLPKTDLLAFKNIAGTFRAEGTTYPDEHPLLLCLRTTSGETRQTMVTMITARIRETKGSPSKSLEQIRTNAVIEYEENNPWPSRIPIPSYNPVQLLLKLAGVRNPEKLTSLDRHVYTELLATGFSSP